MATNFQSVDDRLTGIKTTLQNISSSLSTATPEQKTQLSAALNSTGAALSSEQARRSVANAQESSPGTSSSGSASARALAMANAARTEAEAKAKKAEQAQKDAEATASISDQRSAKSKTGSAPGSTGGTNKAASTPEEDKKMAFQELMQREPMLGEYGLTEENLADPMVIATLRNQVANTQQIKENIVRLDEMVQKKEERTREQVALIGTSIKNQEAQLKVEQRKRTAAEGMAGILSNRSLYSPEEHQGLIQEVVQEGILKLQEIQIEGYKLQNEMWEDFDDYEFEKYTAKSEQLKEYNKLELDTVTSIQTRLQNIAKTQQQKLVFDQAQMDRSSLILAEELVGSSDEAIREAATTQGVDYGLLKRAVADASFTQEDRNLSLQSKRLTIQAQQKAASEETEDETEEPLTSAQRAALIKEYGLEEGTIQIPIGWKESNFAKFAASYDLNGKDNVAVAKYIKEYEEVISGKMVPYSEADDSKKTSLLKDAQESLKIALETVPDSEKNKLDALGVNRKFWDSRATEKAKLLESEKVKQNLIKYLEQGYTPSNAVEIMMNTSLNQ